ncbi:MAG: TrkA family potassium uptake protein [Ignavibacteria bacterium]|nr:TrkA family potassium uptake protein [Ignavibacteria bacterium]
MAKKIAIIGLGDFGIPLATTLTELGAEVLAIDSNFNVIEEIKDKVTVAVRLDSTDERALKAQGIIEMDAVVVSIGAGFEDALLTIMNLIHMGVKRIIARSTSPVHKKILSKVGVKEVISPEEEISKKLASNLIHEDILDYIPLGSGHNIVHLKTPDAFIGKSIQELDLRIRYNVNLITIKKFVTAIDKKTSQSETVEKIAGVPSASTVLEKDDILILFGRDKDIQKLID